jgi:hypothetical protein
MSTLQTPTEKIKKKRILNNKNNCKKNLYRLMGLEEAED